MFSCRNINVFDCRALPPAPLGMLNNTEHATAYPCESATCPVPECMWPQGAEEGAWTHGETHLFSRSGWWPPHLDAKKKLSALKILFFNSSDASEHRQEVSS